MTAPERVEGMVAAVDIPLRTILEGQSGAYYIRTRDWRPDFYPEHLPPFTFTKIEPDAYTGAARALQVEDDGPLEVIRWGG